MAQFSCAFLSEEDKEYFNKEVIFEEIKDGLWSLKPFKAPRADELHAGFFQLFWHDVNKLVCKEVNNIFNIGVVLEYLNKTLIALIPKCRSLEMINNYRPINLYNSIYKIVTKVIIARIRHLLSNLVSSMQASFVPSEKDLIMSL